MGEPEEAEEGDALVEEDAPMEGQEVSSSSRS
jgi:hypothetical protein